MHVQPNIVARSHKHYYRGKASSTVYAVSVSVAFIHRICQAHAPYSIDICGLTSFPNFSTLSHKLHGFRKKSLNVKYVF